jgi:hypothetical protein
LTEFVENYFTSTESQQFRKYPTKIEFLNLKGTVDGIDTLTYEELKDKLRNYKHNNFFRGVGGLNGFKAQDEPDDFNIPLNDAE